MADPQPDLYTVVCHIFGSDAIFSVEIAGSRVVDALKDEINAKEKLVNSEDADRLALYLGNIRNDDDFEKNLNRLLSSSPPLKALRASEKLNIVFKGTPAERTVHILVKVPEIGKKAVLYQLPLTSLTSSRFYCHSP